MPDKTKHYAAVFQELKALVQKSFPKTCATCGQCYDTLEDFLANTVEAPHGTGFMEQSDFDDRSIVDILRNCRCGSTLMVVCNERRDMSNEGAAMRDAFGRLLEHLVESGLDRNIGRIELLRSIHGRYSPILKDYGLPASIIDMDT